MGLDKSTTAATGPMLANWLIPILLIAVSLAIALGGDDARLLFRYDRVWIAQGQSWRFLTGHLSHLAWGHLLLNAAGLVLVWFLIGSQFTTRQWWWIVGVTVAVIDLGFWILSSELYWYVGLSGLLHGILAAGLVVQIRHANAETIVLALLLAAKLTWEQFGGAIPGSEATSGGPVIVIAHLYGTVGGILGALISRIRVRPQASI